MPDLMPGTPPPSAGPSPSPSPLHVILVSSRLDLQRATSPSNTLQADIQQPPSHTTASTRLSTSSTTSAATLSNIKPLHASHAPDTPTKQAPQRRLFRHSLPPATHVSAL